jgi:hypothetical protein
VLVSAVAYDDKGAITGGGFTFVEFVPASGQAPVEVSLTTTRKPAKIELYARVSGLSALMADTSAAPAAKPLALVTKGYGQDKNEIGFGFIVENPNTALAVERSQYQIAAYDKAGTVLKTDSGYISLLLPGQKLGMAGTVSVPEGTVVDRFDVQVKPGEFEESDALPSFTTENVAYQAGEFSSKVLGVIKSPYKQDVDEVHVAAIVYDDKGAIIGGGFTFVSFVPANGQAAVEVSVTTAGKPAKVELHPTISGLSSFGNAIALPKGAEAPMIVAKGYAEVKGEVGFGFVVENPSGAHAIERTRYQVAAYDEAGNVLKTDAGYLDLLLPKQKLGMGGSLSLPEGATVARVDMQIKAGEYESAESQATLTTENVAFVADTFSSKVTGIVKSRYAKDIKSVRATAVAYDESGSIIGGGFSYVDLVPANGQAAAEVSVTVPGKPAKIELYAALSSLSDVEK